MSFTEISDDSEKLKKAAREGRLEDVIALLVKFSNDIELLNETLIWSCAAGHLEVVKWLAEHTTTDVNYSGKVTGINVVNEEFSIYYTPVTAACGEGHLNVVKYLLEIAHADVNLPDSGEWAYTPLTRACGVSMPVSMYLLSEVTNLDVNIANSIGYTALHAAIWLGKNRGRTQLHNACIEGDMSEVDRLVYESDHMINLQDNAGYSPLHCSCYFGRSDVVKTLMLAGADETIRNSDTETPAQLAEERGHRNLLKLLNRVSLLEEMLISKLMNKLSSGFLVILSVQLMRRKITRQYIA